MIFPPAWATSSTVLNENHNPADPTMAQGQAFRPPHGRSREGCRSAPNLGSSLHSIPLFDLKSEKRFRLYSKQCLSYLKAPHRCHGPTITTLNLKLAHTWTSLLMIMIDIFRSCFSPSSLLSPSSDIFSLAHRS